MPIPLTSFASIVDNVNPYQNQDLASALSKLPFPYSMFGVAAVKANQAQKKQPKPKASLPVKVETSPSNPVENRQQTIDDFILSREAEVKNGNDVNLQHFAPVPDTQTMPWVILGAALIQALSGGQSGTKALTGFMSGYKNRSDFENGKALSRYQEAKNKATATIGQKDEAMKWKMAGWKQDDEKAIADAKAKAATPAFAEQPFPKIDDSFSRLYQNVFRSAVPKGLLSKKISDRLSRQAPDWNLQYAPQILSDWKALDTLIASKEKGWKDLGIPQAQKIWETVHSNWRDSTDGYSFMTGAYQKEALTRKNRIARYRDQINQLVGSTDPKDQAQLRRIHPLFEAELEKLTKIAGEGGILDRIGQYRDQMRDTIAYLQPPGQTLKRHARRKSVVKPLR
jgi:hypothetical protein